jgi:hypothetical protein
MTDGGDRRGSMLGPANQRKALTNQFQTSAMIGNVIGAVSVATLTQYSYGGSSLTSLQGSRRPVANPTTARSKIVKPRYAQPSANA